MKSPNISTSRNIVPMIYAYTTPEIERHKGWTKIGYTEQNVKERIKQQTHTADIVWNLEWQGNAIYEDGSGELFTDKDFHRYLRKCGVMQEEGKNNEWFCITGSDSKVKFLDFKENRGITQESSEKVVPYILRDEQNDAVEKTLEFAIKHENGEFLWNAKPRFGKTLTVYDFCKRYGATNILIVTNRPAIANSWYEDYMKFIGVDSGYYFVSEIDSLKGKEGVISRQNFINLATNASIDEDIHCIEFVSLQDLKGSMYFSSRGIDKLKEVADICWDVLVIDEAHEGVDTYKTDIAFGNINRKFTLHLSGTPFKALANDKFPDHAIYNWTYADEQKAKRDWNVSSEMENPYEHMPKLNMYTYRMSDIIQEELSVGIEVNDKMENYAFDLNEFFSVENNKFKYESSVDKFLDALTQQLRFPFSTPELREELRHTFWILNRVDSAKAMAKKLKEHPVFKDYHVILAAGDGKLDENEETKKSYDKVVEAVATYDRTITLSVGQLTTGVTIPEWTAVLMLSNMKSPALYMQAAFRAQNPYVYKRGVRHYRKENAYVFDFDPARTLDIFDSFANNLSGDTVGGKGDTDKRKEKIKDLINFFPVIGEDENGELVELDAEDVLTIPRKIRSVEVVNRGFMSNFLFQNISNVFGAEKEIVEIISKFDPVTEPKKSIGIEDGMKEDLSIDDDGNVSIPEEKIIGISREIFGDKIFVKTEEIEKIIPDMENTEPKAEDKIIKNIKKTIKESVSDQIIKEAKAAYTTDIKTSDEKRLTSKLNKETDKLVDEAVTNYKIEKNKIEKEKTEALQSRHETGVSVSEIEKTFGERNKRADEDFQKKIISDIQTFVEESQKEIVKDIEIKISEEKKAIAEKNIRDHLRGFSRSIPSFLMAYGDDSVTLENFDKIIPDNVFFEVTSITLDQFRFLRDGGKYIDKDTGEEKEFKGNLFEPVIFDDSIREFLALKKNLSNYFDDLDNRDIFDYIPPQKTNQIFTPKSIVKRMVDMLEEENPGCFDSPDKTFMDLYMKSGLYIAEIVKRLYQSPNMKRIYPNRDERLKHIFEKQVYGLAPTEIIYRIATNFILGFDMGLGKIKHNFKHLDALPYAKNGTLGEKLDEIYCHEK